MTTLLSAPTLITAVVGAFAGAIMGGVVSHLTAKRRDRRARQIRLASEFSALVSNYEAALIRFRQARTKDQSIEMSDNSYSVLSDLITIDGSAQKLWWEFSEAFPQKDVVSSVWEYLRRVSLTKQMLLFSEHRDAEFAEGLTWIIAQAHKTIEVCSEALEVDSSPGGRPIIVGFAPTDENILRHYESTENPMQKIEFAMAQAKAEEMWRSRRSASSMPPNGDAQQSAPEGCSADKPASRP